MSEYKENLARLVKGGSLSGTGDFFNQFSLMLTGIFITRLFNDPALFGLYAFAFRIIVFLRIMAIPGTDQGIKRYLPMFRSDGNRAAVKGLLLYVFKITGILSLSVVAVLLVFAPGIASIFNKPEASGFIRILCLSIPFYAFMVAATSSLTAIHQVKYQVFVEKMLIPVVRLLILFGFLFVGIQKLRNLAVVWSLTLVYALGCAIAVYFFLSVFKVLRNRSVKPEYHPGELIKFSLPLAASRPLAYLMTFVGTFIIAYYLDKADIGRYEVVTLLALLLTVPHQSAILVFAPLISELHHQGRNDELHRHYKFVAKWTFTLCLFIFMALTLFARPLMNIFGRGYSDVETHRTLAIIGFTQLFNAGVGPTARMISMTGRPRVNLYNNIILVVLSIGLGLILVPRIGIIGAGLCQAIAIVGVNTLFLLQIRHYLGMHPFSLGYFKPLVAGILSSGIVFVIIHLTGLYGIFEILKPEELTGYLWVVGYILVSGSILALLFGLFIYLFGLDEEDRFILGKMFSKLRRIRPTSSTPGE